MFKNLADYFKHKKTKDMFFVILVDIILAVIGVPMAEALILIITGLGGVKIFGQSLSDGLSKGVTATKTTSESENT